MVRAIHYQKIKKQASKGNKHARRLLQLYGAYAANPRDTTVEYLLGVAYADWKKKNS